MEDRKQVCEDATLECSYGEENSHLIVTNNHIPVCNSGRKVATIEDHVEIKNIPSFKICKAPSHYQEPCDMADVTISIWTPGSQDYKVDGIIALTKGSSCQCRPYGGKITVVDCNQEHVYLS